MVQVITLDLLLQRLRDEWANPTLSRIMLSWSEQVKVSAYADDVTVAMSCHKDIKMVKQALAGYKKISGAKVNLKKSEKLE